MGQDIFDVIVVLVLVFFTLRGFWNGFVGEVAGLVSLVGGFWAAHNFHPLLSEYLTFISEPAWRQLAAYVLIFVATLILVAVLARILQKVLSFSFVAWVDRLAGGILGLAKGLLLCSIVLLVLQKLMGNMAFLQNSRALPYFTSLIEQIRAWLPPDVLSWLNI